MTLSRGFVRNAPVTPLDARLMDLARMVQNSDGTPRPGVIMSPINLVTTTATMHVNVGRATFAVSKGQADGVVILANDGVVSVPVSPAPASNSRIDVIWVKHNDDTTGDLDALPVFGVTAGAAAASPTKPAIPTGALELATLRVYAGTTATNGGSNVLTNTYQRTAAAGGVIAMRNAEDLAAYASGAGALAYMRDTDVLLHRRTGSGGWALTSPIETRTVVDSGGGVANGTSLKVLNFAALPVDTVVEIMALMQVGNTSGSAGTYAPNMSNSTGGTVSELPISNYNVPSGQWVAVPRDARLVIPADTAATHTTLASSTQNGHWKGALITRRYAA